MKWTMRYEGEERSLAQWGLTQLKRTCASQGADTVILAEGYRPLEEAALLQAQKEVEILKEGKPWFRGVVTQVPAWGNAVQETRQYVISGPWWYLQNTVYQQSWANPMSKTQVESGHIVLGLNSQGQEIKTGAQLKDILQYAIACGAPFQLGKILAGVTFPMVEAKDITCGEALRRVLRWHPDAVCWFDYSQSTPALNIDSQDKLDEETIDLKDNGSIESVRINAKEDEQISEVVICYEGTEALDEGLKRIIERDAYPRGGTGKKPKALVMTVSLEPAQTTVIEQPIKVRPIQADSLEWWQEHLPFLSEVDPEKVKIDKPQQPEILDQELLEGQIADWMPVRAQAAWISAQLSWETPLERVVRRKVRVQVIATNAQTKVYTKTIVEPMEQPPEKSLARTLYESLRSTPYRGHLCLLLPELPATGFLGKRLVLEGGPEPEIEVLVQSVSEDLATGRVSLNFGPPKHLGVRDLITLLQLNRQREVPRELSWRNERALEKGQGPEALAQGRFGPRQNVRMGASAYSKLCMSDAKNYPLRTIRIDLEDLPEGIQNRHLTVRLRRQVHFDGKNQYESYVLATQQFPVASGGKEEGP